MKVYKICKKIGLVSVVLASFLTLSWAPSKANIKPVVPSLEERAVQYVKRNAISGKEFLINKVKENRITIFGEVHGMINFGKKDGELIESVVREERLLADSIPELKAVGLKYLAVEMSEEYGPSIENYIKTGVKDVHFEKVEQAFLWGDKAFYTWIDAVRTAMNNRLEMVYIDTSAVIEDMEAGDYRDAYMARKVKEVFEKDKEAKMLTHIGALHAVEKGFSKNYQMAFETPKTLAEILSKDFDCYSILAEPFFILGNLPKELYRTDKIVGFDVDESPMADLKGRQGFDNYGDAFDGIIIFPKEVSGTYI